MGALTPPAAAQAPWASRGDLCCSGHRRGKRGRTNVSPKPETRTGQTPSHLMLLPELERLP